MIYVKKKLGKLETFQDWKIALALESILEIDNKSQNKDYFESIALKTKDYFEALGKEIVSVNEIESFIEKTLMEDKELDLVKAYILYSHEKKEKIEKQKEKIQEKLENNKLKVTKNNGKLEYFDIKKVEKTFNIANKGCKVQCKFSEIENQFKKSLIEKITTSGILELLISLSINQISVNNSKWQLVAGRLEMMKLYKKASKNRKINVDEIYSPNNVLKHLKEYIKKGYYSEQLREAYTDNEIIKLSKKIVQSRDFSYGYTTITMLNKRYLHNVNGVIKELPQEMYLFASLFLALPEKKEKRLEVALDFYNATSTGKLSLATPTLMNARTKKHQLASCFVLNADDDLRGIFHQVENIAQISKGGGGVGIYFGNIRSKGSTIRGINGIGKGTLPWAKIINDTALAVDQLGQRTGAVSVTLDIWHNDIEDFLEMQLEAGDIRSKSFDLFPAVSIPDLFMKKMINNEDWYTFDPKEIKDLKGWSIQDFFGDEFEEKYNEVLNDYIDGKLKQVKKLNAKDLFKQLMKTVVETGMPYIFFRDTANNQNPNSHKGNVYSSQLCTEIIQNTSPSKFIEEVTDDGDIVIRHKAGDSVVCNLASINIAKVNTREEIKKITLLGIRLLDNVIDLNLYPIEESRITAERYRSIGLGFLGLAEYLATKKIAYDSKEAVDETRDLFEQFGYYSIKGSSILAKERGSYPYYEGSKWSQGIFFGKNEKELVNNNKMGYEWSKLIKEVKENGMRNSYLLSPAPNTSTSLVIGTTAGLLPVYKKLQVENNGVKALVNVAPNLNKENFWFYKEYIHTKVDDVIDVIAAAQEYVDQSISFEWLLNPERDEPKDIFLWYVKAWEKKIKTIYYVRSMSLETKECLSCSG